MRRYASEKGKQVPGSATLCVPFVSSSLSGCAGRVGEGLYIFILLIEEVETIYKDLELELRNSIKFVQDLL